MCLLQLMRSSIVRGGGDKPLLHLHGWDLSCASVLPAVGLDPAWAAFAILGLLLPHYGQQKAFLCRNFSSHPLAVERTVDSRSVPVSVYQRAFKKRKKTNPIHRLAT